MSQLETFKKTEKSRVRFKEYKCVFPGCSEGLKTKYNCISHIWDIHLRHLNSITEAYKNLSNRDQARILCLPYLKYVENSESERKRKPYDLGNILNRKNDFNNQQMTLGSPPPQQTESTSINNDTLYPHFPTNDFFCRFSM
ncbi:hypothetical protein QTN25_003150 [Entamoeba marina]